MLLPVKFIFVNIFLFGILGSLMAQNQSCNNDLEKESQLRKERFKQWGVGAQVPDINFTGSTSLYTSKARTILILFWKTDCPYCEKLMPLLEQIRSDFTEDQLTIVAICLDEKNEDWLQLPRVKKPISQWIDKFEEGGFMGEDAVNYHIFGTPTLFVLDAKYCIKGFPKGIEQLKQLISN